MKWFSVSAIALVLLAGTARANSSPLLPEDQWNDDVALWLARAMVSEADWSYRDHAAIAWVLKRRWETQVKRDPNWTFLEQVKAYCAAMHGKVRTRRHVWVRSLAADGTKPLGWYKNVEWEEYRPSWEKVQRLAQAWVAGQVKDPCRSRADHWGGPMDPKPKKWKTVNCGPTKNIFYNAPAEP